MKKTLTGLAAALALMLGGASTSALAEDPFITVQSTTSTQNSGLYEYLLPLYKAKSGVDVHVVAVGTGQALKNAQNCDGDVVLVHAKSAEEKFVADGYGVKRTDLMYNDFIVVGAPADPAGVNGSKDTIDSFKKIAAAKAPFASRGDDSGTNKKELQLWKEAGIDPKTDSGGWYRETGSGMGATLNTGIGMGAYVLTDRATWISYGNKGDYVISVEGDKKLFNQYGVILVNPEKCPSVKVDLGQQFIDWLLSAEGQTAIAGYKIEGQQ
ncbi:MAG: substrate-binding domain-containing protein, partial [Alphaproteobacteria bacterium]|nr:substrate-binding domain-containing protein [Alphaproteobacteria bacterium]